MRRVNLKVAECAPVLAAVQALFVLMSLGDRRTSPSLRFFAAMAVCLAVTCLDLIRPHGPMGPA